MLYLNKHNKIVFISPSVNRIFTASISDWTRLRQRWFFCQRHSNVLHDCFFFLCCVFDKGLTRFLNERLLLTQSRWSIEWSWWSVIRFTLYMIESCCLHIIWYIYCLHFQAFAICLLRSYKLKEWELNPLQTNDPNNCFRLDWLLTLLLWKLPFLHYNLYSSSCFIVNMC